MASIEGSIQNAANRAARRWASDKSSPLKEQIVDTFRLSKELKTEYVRLLAIRKFWKDAFEAVDCGSNFNFDDEETI